MSKCLKVVLLVVCISVLSLSFVYGKDMAKKTGVGFYQLSPVPRALSVRHWLCNKIALNFVLGLDFFEVAGENCHDVVMGMKILTVVKAEQQLNAFIGGGFDLEFAGNGDSTTAYRMKFLTGVEYFFRGLPNLGFGAEIGFQIGEDIGFRIGEDNGFQIGKDSYFGTTYGDVGIHYYY